MQPAEGKKTNVRAWALVALHVLLFIYSTTSLFSKNAARVEFGSPAFFAFYAGMLAVLVVYAIGWQQVIKHLPLTVAFTNKAVTVAWGIMWGWTVFGEQVTPPMIAGAVLVMAGVVLFGIADAREQRANQEEVPHE